MIEKPSFESIMRCLFFLSICLFSQHWISGQTMVFNNTNFTSPLPFQSNMDSLLISNCNFNNLSAEAIRFENISYVSITNSNFSNITLSNSTRAVICGKKSSEVILRNLHFENIGGTAIRFPTDGETSALKRLGTVSIDSVIIDGTFDPIDVFESNGIRIFLTDTVYVRNCQLRNINDNGISLGRNSSGQIQTDQRIDYNEISFNVIDSVLGNGILASENAGLGYVHHNVITNIATNGIGMLDTEGDHGMYWQAPGALIKANTVQGVFDGQLSGNTGNGISLRTNARVIQNTVSNCTRNGIAYWNDHSGSGMLEITNNLVYDTYLNGIYVNGSGPDPLKPDTVLIHHNTVHSAYDLGGTGVVHHYSPVAINTMASYNEVFANLLLFDNRSDSIDFIRFIGPVTSQNTCCNFFAEPTSGFMDIPSGDYHLLSSNNAIDFIPPGVTEIDIDLEELPRIGLSDAGCYEYQASSELDDLTSASVFIYPNPTKDKLVIVITESNQGYFEMLDYAGRIVLSGKLSAGQNELMLPEIYSGVYFLRFNDQQLHYVLIH